MEIAGVKYSHYSVVTGASFSVNGALVELVNEVSAVMLYGWEPLGGATYCGQETIKGRTDHVFAQTLIKRVPLAEVDNQAEWKVNELAREIQNWDGD